MLEWDEGRRILRWTRKRMCIELYWRKCVEAGWREGVCLSGPDKGCVEVGWVGGLHVEIVEVRFVLKRAGRLV